MSSHFLPLMMPGRSLSERRSRAHSGVLDAQMATPQSDECAETSLFRVEYEIHTFVDYYSTGMTHTHVALLSLNLRLAGSHRLHAFVESSCLGANAAALSVEHLFIPVAVGQAQHNMSVATDADSTSKLYVRRALLAQHWWRQHRTSATQVGRVRNTHDRLLTARFRVRPRSSSSIPTNVVDTVVSRSLAKSLGTVGREHRRRRSLLVDSLFVLPSSGLVRSSQQYMLVVIEHDHTVIVPTWFSK